MQKKHGRQGGSGGEKGSRTVSRKGAGFPHRLGEATACNVLVYDRRGYGQSDPFADAERPTDYLEAEADVLDALLTNPGIGDAILFGHSDGGSIALIAAAKYPRLVRAMIVEGAPIFVEEVTLTGIRQAVLAYQKTDLKNRLAKYHGDKTDRIFRAWTETWLRVEYRTWNTERFLPAIGCPVRVVQGENDEYGTLRQAEGIASGVRGAASRFIVPGAGHTPHKEAAPETLSRAADFIPKHR
ncbi:MAG: alpha/beta hydrolase [Cytophagales bacterium]|nr:alpha/beta hydrolase [Cytophagales bacterium]